MLVYITSSCRDTVNMCVAGQKSTRDQWNARHAFVQTGSKACFRSFAIATQNYSEVETTPRSATSMSSRSSISCVRSTKILSAWLIVLSSKDIEL